MPRIPRNQKWSPAEVAIRGARAARLRAARRAVTPSDVRSGELALVRECVSDEYLQEEPRLVEPRWLTYSYMSALQCTELFCQLYLGAWRTYYGRVRNITTGQRMPVDEQLFKNDLHQISGLWRARQAADRIGMPYDIFLNAVFGWAAGQKNRKRFPAPNQLYGTAQLEVARRAWEQASQTLHIFGEHWDDRLFLGDEKAGLPRQKAIRLVYQRVNRSPNPEVALANYLGRAGAIDEVLARRMFRHRAGLVDDAMRHVVASTNARTPAEPKQYVPSCLGITFDIPEPACSACSVAHLCERLWHKTSKELEGVTGSSDPRKARHREMATNRKRRSRERKREREMASSQVAT